MVLAGKGVRLVKDIPPPGCCQLAPILPQPVWIEHDGRNNARRASANRFDTTVVVCVHLRIEAHLAPIPAEVEGNTAHSPVSFELLDVGVDTLGRDLMKPRWKAKREYSPVDEIPT